MWRPASRTAPAATTRCGSTSSDRELPDFQAEELLAAVSAALGGRVADPGEWSATSIFEPIVSGTGGIWRLRGPAWSLVLKLCWHSDAGHANWLSGADPGHWYYWKREPLVYETGLAASLTGGLRGPRCYLAADGPGEQVRLWLEDVEGRPATRWPLERYGLAARHLGRAQGAFLVDRPLPDAPWLSRDWLRAYLAMRNTDIPLLGDPAAWAAPLVAGSLPAELAAAGRRLWDDQARFLGVLDGLPRTLCHLDLHPKNLFDVEGETVLIDWSFAGLGAVGEDAGNLVPDSVLDFHVAATDIDRLWEVVAAGYTAGLADAGWTGDPALVRRGMAALIAAKYAWILPALLRAARDGRPTFNGRPIAEAVAWWAPAVPFLFEMAQLART